MSEIERIQRRKRIMEELQQINKIDPQLQITQETYLKRIEVLKQIQQKITHKQRILYHQSQSDQSKVLQCFFQENQIKTSPQNIIRTPAAIVSKGQQSILSDARLSSKQLLQLKKSSDKMGQNNSSQCKEMQPSKSKLFNQNNISRSLFASIEKKQQTINDKNNFICEIKKEEQIKGEAKMHNKAFELKPNLNIFKAESQPNASNANDSQNKDQRISLIVNSQKNEPKDCAKNEPFFENPIQTFKLNFFKPPSKQTNLFNNATQTNQSNVFFTSNANIFTNQQSSQKNKFIQNVQKNTKKQNIFGSSKQSQSFLKNNIQKNKQQQVQKLKYNNLFSKQALSKSFDVTNTLTKIIENKESKNQLFTPSAVTQNKISSNQLSENLKKKQSQTISKNQYLQNMLAQPQPQNNKMTSSHPASINSFKKWQQTSNKQGQQVFFDKPLTQNIFAKKKIQSQNISQVQSGVFKPNKNIFGSIQTNIFNNQSVIFNNVQKASQKIPAKSEKIFGTLMEQPKQKQMLMSDESTTKQSKPLSLFQKTEQTKFQRIKPSNFFPNSGSIFNNVLTKDGSSTGNLFSSVSQKQGNIFSIKNTDPKDLNVEQENEEDSGPLEDKDECDPTKSTGNYQYTETNNSFKEAADKFKLNNNKVIENVSVSVTSFKQKPEQMFIVVRMGNQRVAFTGLIVKGVTSAQPLDKRIMTVKVTKVIDVIEKKIAQIIIQFKDVKNKELFISQINRP